MASKIGTCATGSTNAAVVISAARPSAGSSASGGRAVSTHRSKSLRIDMSIMAASPPFSVDPEFIL